MIRTTPVPPQGAAPGCPSPTTRSGATRPAVYLDTLGYYMSDTFEARFGSGIGFIRPDPDGRTCPARTACNGSPTSTARMSRTGTRRSRSMPASLFVPNIFVSQEDWSGRTQVNTYTINGQSSSNYGVVVTGPSPVVPDLSPPAGITNQNSGGSPSLDWRYSWMFTGQQTNTGNAWFFDGNIVIFENRPVRDPGADLRAPGLCGLSVPGVPGRRRDGRRGDLRLQQHVVVVARRRQPATAPPPTGPCSCAGTTMPDPVVRAGDWIADVTYERQQWVVYNPQTQTGRFESVVSNQGTSPVGYPNPLEQLRVGQPAGPALLLVPGPEGHAGGARSQRQRPSFHDRLCQSVPVFGPS